MSEEPNHTLITTAAGGLIQRMDRRLGLVNRLLGEICENLDKSDRLAVEGLGRIDAEMARCFLENPDAIDLSTPKLLDDDAAALLSGYRGNLYLNGLIELSNSAAASLSKHE